MFLGDSVTHQGFPDFVQHFLNTARPEGAFYESTSLGVAGYSSHQGRVLAETYGSTFDPDVVVLFFGWNDHWKA